ncbi:MAG TPA: carbon storage regulator CsrA [Candidatus Nitrosopolaris sp.]|nr:carbon storage regulator CsrA [Candidatus Nitrosopolaris sp.]
MLVLTRKLGEVIRVGEAITVRVLEVKGNQVRLGVEAPADVRIYREEVYRAIRKETDEGTVPETHVLDEADPPWRSPDRKPNGAGGPR